MDITQIMFELIDSNDQLAIKTLLEEHPGLVHCQKADPEDKRFPLQSAAEKGDLALCRLLVEKGAAVYTNPFNSYPPVMYAKWAGHDEVVRYFLEEIPERADGTQGLGLTINLAAREGLIELVRKHLDRDPLSIHARGWIGDSPLHWPAHNNHVDIVALLIDAGADIEADEVNWVGGRPLHWASEHAPDTVRVLLKAGADVNSRNTRQESNFFQVTPLIMNAIQRDDCSEVTEQLLAAGADISAKDAQGKTALDHAEAKGLTRITAVLKAAQ